MAQIGLGTIADMAQVTQGTVADMAQSKKGTIADMVKINKRIVADNVAEKFTGTFADMEQINLRAIADTGKMQTEQRTTQEMEARNRNNCSYNNSTSRVPSPILTNFFIDSTGTGR